jgi:hypothetical protein
VWRPWYLEPLEQSPPETGQRSGSWLTLALSGEAALASTKTADNTNGELQGEPGSGLVRFNALLAGLSQQPFELRDRETSITNDPTHREGVDGVCAGNGEDTCAIRHDDVLALAYHPETGLLKRAHGVEVVDAGDPGHC